MKVNNPIVKAKKELEEKEDKRIIELFIEKLNKRFGHIKI